MPRITKIRFAGKAGLGFLMAGTTLALAGAGAILYAAEQPPAGETIKIPRLSEPPKIDGVLDNPLWEAEALKIEDFVQLSPKENGTPSEKTVAYLGYDEKNLYVAFRCFDSQAAKIRASITNRDQCLEDDWIVLFLDTFNEKRRAFTFFLNPVGIQIDGIRTEEGGNDNIDTSWDTVFSSDGKVDAGGYTVEAAIPFKSFRFPDRENKVWNLVMGRNLPRTGEIILWPRYSREIPGLISQGRHFAIQGNVQRGKNLEIMPVLTGLQRQDTKADIQPGVNLKYGISSDMTLDTTVNPDFSHIETDDPQIDYNLRYALEYPEKRPFFLEGMEIFNYPEIEMVYTRRIIDPLWGAKLSGKTGRLAYGLLSAYDLNPTESLWDVHNGGANKDDNALFNIFRLKSDIFNRESYLGFTLADKEIDGSWNRVAGLDGQWRFRNKFFFSFQAIGSKTRSEGRETDFAPALYGDFYYFTKRWTAGAYWMSIHPEFEAASGFVNRTDYRTLGAYTSFSFYPDRKYLNNIYLNLRVGQRLGYFNDVAQDRWLEGTVQFRFTEFNRMWVRYRADMERYADIPFDKRVLSVEAESQFLAWMPFNFYLQTGDSINYDPNEPFLGWSNIYSLGLTFKPEKRIQLGLNFLKQTFWRSRGGEELWDYNVLRLRATYQLTKTLSVRAIGDYNHFYKDVFGSLLFSWILRPGTVFFFGFDSNYLRDELGIYKRDNYNVFVKFSYWWRI